MTVVSMPVFLGFVKHLLPSRRILALVPLLEYNSPSDDSHPKRSHRAMAVSVLVNPDQG